MNTKKYSEEERKARDRESKMRWYYRNKTAKSIPINSCDKCKKNWADCQCWCIGCHRDWSTGCHCP